MRSSLISFLLAIIIFSSTRSWANEISKTEYFTSIKSLPICRFVYNSVEPWHDCYGLHDYGNGNKYFGDWVHNRPEGWGIRIDEEFSYFYIGQFLNGEENGYGLSGYLSDAASFYLGTYEQGNREGGSPFSVPMEQSRLDNLLMMNVMAYGLKQMLRAKNIYTNINGESRSFLLLSIKHLKGWSIKGSLKYF